MHRFLIALAAGLCLVCPAEILSADPAVPREHHPWGRFKVGSWKEVRVLTETFDAQGKVVGTSTTETRSTLVELDAAGYVLEVEVTVEVAGKRIASQPKYVRQGFNGESEGQRLISLKRLGPGALMIDGKSIRSEVRQVVLNGGDQKRTTTIHYCHDLEPYVLKRESSTTDAAGQTTLSQNVVEVVSLETPFRLLGERKSAAQVQIVHSRPGAKTVTLETHCPDVPGTVVAAASKEFDEQDRLVKQSTLELVDFDLGDGRVDDDKNNRRRGLFHRRARKAAAAMN